jgi:hypothetical protein
MKLRDLLSNVVDSQHATRLDIAEIRKDLAYHIKRTDLIEERMEAERKEVKPLLDGYKFLKVSGALIFLAGAAASILKLFL